MATVEMGTLWTASLQAREKGHYVDSVPTNGYAFRSSGSINGRAEKFLLFLRGHGRWRRPCNNHRKTI